MGTPVFVRTGGFLEDLYGDAPEKPETDWGFDQPYELTPQQQKINDAIAGGADPYDAVEQTTGVPARLQKQQEALQRLHEQGYTGDFNQASSNSYNDLINQRYLDAENATNGYLLNPGAKRRGVDPKTLFYGPESYARAHASDELMDYWASNGRPNLEDHRQQLIHGTGTPNRNDFAPRTMQPAYAQNMSEERKIGQTEASHLNEYDLHPSDVKSCQSTSNETKRIGSNSNDLYGKGFDDFMSLDSPLLMAPFPMAGRLKNQPLYDKDAVAQALSNPALSSIDPRTLHKTQPYVVKDGLRHYMSDPNTTYKDQGNAGNQYPVVYTRANGQNVLLSGHHRATVALLTGRPLMAVHVMDPAIPQNKVAKTTYNPSIDWDAARNLYQQRAALDFRNFTYEPGQNPGFDPSWGEDNYEGFSTNNAQARHIDPDKYRPLRQQGLDLQIPRFPGSIAWQTHEPQPHYLTYMAAGPWANSFQRARGIRRSGWQLMGFDPKPSSLDPHVQHNQYPSYGRGDKQWSEPGQENAMYAYGLMHGIHNAQKPAGHLYRYVGGGSELVNRLRRGSTFRVPALSFLHATDDDAEPIEALEQYGTGNDIGAMFHVHPGAKAVNGMVYPNYGWEGITGGKFRVDNIDHDNFGMPTVHLTQTETYDPDKLVDKRLRSQQKAAGMDEEFDPNEVDISDLDHLLDGLPVPYVRRDSADELGIADNTTQNIHGVEPKTSSVTPDFVRTSASFVPDDSKEPLRYEPGQNPGYEDGNWDPDEEKDFVPVPKTAAAQDVVLYHGTSPEGLEHVRQNGLSTPASVMHPASWPMLTDNFDQAARYSRGKVIEYHFTPDELDYHNGLLWPGQEHNVYDQQATAYAPQHVPADRIVKVHDVGRTAASQYTYQLHQSPNYPDPQGLDDEGQSEFLRTHSNQVGAYRDGQMVGFMRLEPSDGMVGNVYVNAADRRNGVATGMWNFAREQGLNPQHSDIQTKDGRGWARVTASAAATPDFVRKVSGKTPVRHFVRSASAARTSATPYDWSSVPQAYQQAISQFDPASLQEPSFPVSGDTPGWHAANNDLYASSLVHSVAKPPITHWLHDLGSRYIRNAGWDLLGSPQERNLLDPNGSAPDRMQQNIRSRAALNAYSLMRGIHAANPLQQPAYRGARPNDAQMASVMENLKPGTTFSLPPTSYTMSPALAEDFGTNLTFKILPGSKGIHGDNYDWYDGIDPAQAREYVTGGKFRVEGIEPHPHKPTGRVINLRQINTYDPDALISGRTQRAAADETDVDVSGIDKLFDGRCASRIPSFVREAARTKTPDFVRIGKKVRHVQTPEGEDHFGLPIGSPIGQGKDDEKTARKGMGDMDIDPEMAKDMMLAPGSTAAQHLQRNADGTYSFDPERQKMHDAIISKWLTHDADGNKVARQREKTPTMMVLGGGPASGKSNIVRSGLTDAYSGKDPVLVNPDEMKAELPEYVAMARDRDPMASVLAHEESSYLAKRLQKAAIENGYNITVDGTGDTSVASLSKKIDAARKAGYKVNGSYATIPMDMAVQRAEARAQKTGRGVPESIIRGTHASVSRILPQAIGKFDNLQLVDSSQRDLVPIMRAHNGKAEILDPQRWQEFKEKANG